MRGFRVAGLDSYLTLLDGCDAQRFMVDGSTWLARPEFWPAYYLSQSIEDDELLIQSWGLGRSELRRAQQQLLDPEVWPTFTIRLSAGASLVVVFRNAEDDCGVDYLVDPGSGQDCVRVAALEGDYQGPGISWPELLGVADRISDPANRATSLLLLGPMLGDVRAGSEQALEHVTHALRIAGARRHLDEIANMILIDNPNWESVCWHVDESGVNVCDSEWSPRNPLAECALPLNELRMTSEVLSISG